MAAESERDLNLEKTEYYWRYLSQGQRLILSLAVVVYAGMLNFVNSKRGWAVIATLYVLIISATVLVVYLNNVVLALFFGILFGALTVAFLFYLVFKYLL